MKRIVLSIMAGLLLAPFIFSGTSDATVFGGKFVRSGVFTLNLIMVAPTDTTVMYGREVPIGRLPRQM